MNLGVSLNLIIKLTARHITKKKIFCSSKAHQNDIREKNRLLVEKGKKVD